MKMIKSGLLAVASAAFFIACASAQTPGTVTNHALPIGKGAGTSGYGSLLLPSAQIPVGQTGADPQAKAVTGDITMDALGVTAIGGNKVTNAQFRQSGALALVGRAANSTGNVADVLATAGSSCVFLESASALTCANIATANIANSAVTFAKFQNLAGLSMFGNCTASAAPGGNVTGTANQVLRVNGAGTSCAFGAVDLSQAAAVTGTLQAASEPAHTGDVTNPAGSLVLTIGTNKVTNAQLAQAGAATLRGNPTNATANVQDFTIQGLTARGAPDAANDKIPLYDAAAGTIKYVTPGQVASAGASGVSSLNGLTGALQSYYAPQGRLTLTSGAPVMTAGVAAATNVYYTPAIGDLVPIYDGTNLVPSVFAELTIALGSNWTTNTNYDVFIINDAGTVRACTGPSWNSGAVAGSDNARGTGAGSTDLARVKGIWFNANSITCRYNNTTTVAVSAQRGTYVGSFRTAAAGQVNFAFPGASAGGTAGNFTIYNNYNMTQYVGAVSDTTSTWTYGAGGQWRAANGSTTARVSMLRGFDTLPVVADYNCTAQAGSGGTAACGIGLNVTNAVSGTNTIGGISTNSVVLPAKYAGLAGLGYTFVAPLEYMTAAVATFVGSAGSGYSQTGMTVALWY